MILVTDAWLFVSIKDLGGESMTEMSFFVYGSMTEGFVHFSRVREFVSEISAAKILGSAYRLKVGFPVLLETGNDAVPGQLLKLSSLTSIELLLAMLDEFHGVNHFEPQKSLYFRKEISVTTGGGEQKAWAYFLNPEKLPVNSVKIEGGDWLSSLAEKPALTDKLSERQKVYVQKLGTISGRDIVPIDLGLYRELMNLELIVDKGRRLALSKLGQEVYRYLG